MLRLTATVWLALFLALAGCFGLGTHAQASQPVQYQAIDAVSLVELPPEVQQTLRLIQRGEPFLFPNKDGSTFGNFENRLPPQKRGYYREYTGPTPSRHDRGARRLIAGSGQSGDVARSGEYYYTEDHYGHFRRIVQP